MRLNELAREYESQRYPPTRRLDLQGEGPDTARQRALRWIQSHAHEQPGVDLLLIVERARRPGGRSGPIRTSIEKLLAELQGGLVDWWQPFAEGSLAVRVAADPRRWGKAAPTPDDPTEGRSDETAGRAYLHPEADIPEPLIPVARRAAELRRTREGQPVGVSDVVLREVWIEAQAAAFTDRIDWETALRAILAQEERRILEAYDRD
ncbi:MAG TPA: hypothetical protein VF665_16735 [Longimicrobium sp.]|jgi:hypothetical protein|uniref:hypothetical protein n=1 Tax=Longimicrobium sp. TaxID=2029185 RepID=UPI002EDB8B0F